MSVQQNLYPIPLHCSKHPPSATQQMKHIMMIVFTGISEFHKRNIIARRGIQQQSRILQSTGCIFHHLLHEHIYCSIPVYRRRELRLQYSSADESASDCWMHNLHTNTGYQGISKQHVHRFIRCFRPLFQTFQTYIKAIGSQTFRGYFIPPRIRLQHLWSVSLCFRFF